MSLILGIDDYAEIVEEEGDYSTPGGKWLIRKIICNQIN